MNDFVRLTVLIENSVSRPRLLAEHGVSFYLQTARHTVLFDTGQSDVLRHNAQMLDLPLAAVDAVVLSHGHYDHTGGVPVLRELAPQARLYLHPAAMAPKFARSSETATRAVGLPEASRKAIQQAGRNVVETVKPTEVVEGIFVTGEIPRENSFEDVGGPFFLDVECTWADPLVDDQALFFDTYDGLVVVLGCAHAGVVNTVQHIRRVTNGRPIHAVLGGMHLLTASSERLDRTIEALRQLEVRYLGPIHCTGVYPTARLWQEFRGRCFACPVGTRLTFPLRPC